MYLDISFNISKVYSSAIFNFQSICSDELVGILSHFAWAMLTLWQAKWPPVVNPRSRSNFLNKRAACDPHKTTWPIFTSTFQPVTTIQSLPLGVHVRVSPYNRPQWIVFKLYAVNQQSVFCATLPAKHHDVPCTVTPVEKHKTPCHTLPTQMLRHDSTLPCKI